MKNILPQKLRKRLLRIKLVSSGPSRISNLQRGSNYKHSARALRISAMGYVMETGQIVLADKAAVLLENEKVKKAYLGE